MSKIKSGQDLIDLYDAMDDERKKSLCDFADFLYAQADPISKTLGTCMVKTHLSLSHDPELKNRPTGWELPICDIMVYKGAGFIVPVAGAIKLMPGTASNPAYRRIDVDVNSGKVQGLF